MFRSVNMRSKGDPFFFDFTSVAKRINLIAAAVGQNRFAPAIEAMQSASLLKDLNPGAQVQMVRIAKNDLCPNVFLQFPLVYRFYGSCRADRHKYWRFNDAMSGFNAT